MFGDELRRQRKLLGISQEELGRRAGLSGAAISRFESGSRRVGNLATLTTLIAEFDAASGSTLLRAMIEDTGSRELDPLAVRLDALLHAAAVSDVRKQAIRDCLQVLMGAA